MNVYHVEDDINHYRGFRDRRMDLLDGVYLQILKGISLAQLWTPGPVDMVRGKRGDFLGGPVIFARIGVTSRAQLAIGALLGSCCEFLPFEYSGETLWALYLPKTYPCLDAKQSEFWSKTPDNSSVRRHVFVEHKVPKDLLFRMPGSFHYYCTDPLRELVQQHSLTGLTFRQVWSSDAI